MRVHGNIESGNCLKVKYLLDYLGRNYEWIEIDIFSGAARTPEFRKLNPFGKTPTLELDDGRTLAESNAILCFLAEGSDLFPSEAFARAKVLQWMFFEQYSHEPYLAVARFICRFLPEDHPRRHSLPELREKGNATLLFMEQELAQREWIAGEDFSIADIALYPYTAMAGDAGFRLDEFPAIRGWLDRVATALNV
jgi:glutathione S-transferase